MNVNARTLTPNQWLLGRMTAVERGAGRFLRSPDEHPAAPADAPPATEPSPAPADAQPAADAPAPAAEAAPSGGGVLGAAPDAAPPAEGDAPKAEGEPDAAPAADADAQPYDGLAAPEGFEAIDQDALTAATPLMREFGVPDEKAQDFINKAAPVISGMVDKAVTAQAEAQRTLAETQSATWASEIKADPEFGGSNFDKTVSRAGLALEKFFDTDTRALFTAYSIGNHPGLVKAFAKIGDHFAEGDITPGQPAPVAKGHPLYDDAFLPADQRRG